MPRCAAIAALVVMVALGGTARAEEIVGILKVETEGVSETAAAVFESSLEDGIRDAGFQVAPRERLSHLLLDSPYIDGCVLGPCLGQVHRITEVRLVLVASITAIGSSYSFVVSLLDTRTGRPTSQVAERCGVCTLEEALTAATLVVTEVVTGTGTAAVADPDGDPTAPPDPLAEQRQIDELEGRATAGRRGLRRGALFFATAAVMAAGAAAFTLADDRDELGYAVAAAGGAFALTSGTLLILSRRF